MDTSTSNPYIKKAEDGRLVITQEGEEFLKRIVTDPKGQVYVFTNEAPPLIVAAAMARLSRRGDDLRTIYLDEFAAVGEEHAEDLMDRVITAYGDDSVQQLGVLSFVVEEASNLLTKVLEWGRLMSYLEQSTRYIFYDTLDADGRHKYFTPNIKSPFSEHYREAMDSIFGLYSEVVRGVTAYVRQKFPEPADPRERTAWLGATRAQACDAARPTLPAATKSTVGIVGSAQAVESLIRHMLAHPLEESHRVGALILREARKVMPAFLKRADLPERGLAWVLYDKETAKTMREITQQNLPDISRDFGDEVRLVDYTPKDELDLLPEMLFGKSNHSLKELKQAVSAWSDEKKQEIFLAYIGSRLNRRHKPGRAIEKAHYEWEIVGDYGTFRDLQRHRMVDAWEWQNLTCAYGYDVPPLIVEAGFEEQFRKCFAISESLVNELNNAGYVDEAQYAVLMGYKLRYRFMLNARAAFHFHELRTGPQGHPGYRRIVQKMHDELTRVHPMLGAAMKFVSKSGDPELTRLEAERATQLKLSLLDNKE